MLKKSFSIIATLLMLNFIIKGLFNNLSNYDYLLFSLAIFLTLIKNTTFKKYG